MKSNDKNNIKIILSHLSKKYNIPLNVLTIEVNNLINSIKTTNYNKTKCDAYIMLDGNKVQCSRSKKEGNFCLTHYKQDNKNVLKYGKIDPNNINNDIHQINKFKENNKNQEDIKNPIELEYITINKLDYLYNPITKYVYDFDNHKKIGKLDNNKKIINKHKFN